MSNTTTIFRMVIVTVKTRIATVDTKHRTKQRRGKKSITFRRNNSKGMRACCLSKPTILSLQ